MKEIEREDRIGKARKKREEFQEGMKRREIQTRITENLKILPKNKQILLEKQVNKEMLMCLKEAKEEIWKKWRQRKGRGLKNPGGKLKEYTLEMKLARIEKETDKYKKELEEEEKRNKENKLGLNWAKLGLGLTSELPTKTPKASISHTKYVCQTFHQLITTTTILSFSYPLSFPNYPCCSK